MSRERWQPTLLAVRLLNVLTNDVVSRVPSFRLRAAWYRRLGLELGGNVGVHRGCYVWFFGPGQLRRDGCRIGSGTRISRGCTLDFRSALQIGDSVSIAPEVVILTVQHDWRVAGFPLQHRPVVIEDHVWLGMRAVVLPGSHIGRGAVVAAGAVVSGVVAPGTVVAGIPARPVSTRPVEALDYTFAPDLPLFE